MQLFKRLLISLFPEQTNNQGLNPASMFVSFISTKEFFSVINKKIVENYKLNLFDIAIDSFEAKIGFGENKQIKQKDIDFYYGYCASANINWYRFFNPANVWNVVSLIASIYSKDCFGQKDQNLFLHFLYTVYLLFFVFSAKIKNFPYQSKEKNYNWFIELFFNFYEFILKQSGEKIDQNNLKDIKKKLLAQVELFFFLFYSYQKYNQIFHYEKFPSADFYTRLLWDDFKDSEKDIIDKFADNIKTNSSRTTFSAMDNKVLQNILPADILIRYLFLDTNMSLMIEVVISKLFQKDILNDFMKSFLKDDSKWGDFILYISDHKHYKKNFFPGVQKYLISILKQEWFDLFEDDIEESGSRIDDWEDIENFKIPERIKKESKIMEKILNFFITLLWWFWIGRWDNFFLRLYKKDFINYLIDDNYLNLDENDLQTYWSLLHSYGKNIFYYKYISENVKLGRQRFYLPSKSNSKKSYSSFNILRLINENSLAILLQDINPKDIKIYNKNKKIIELFKKHFSKDISQLLKLKKSDFISRIYQDLDLLFPEKDFIQKLTKHIDKNDIYHIKENLYNVNFWVAQTYYKLGKEKLNKQKNIYNKSLLEIYSQHKETLFGFLLYANSLQQHFDDKHLKFFINLYNRHIIHISDDKIWVFNEIIYDVFAQYQDLIQNISKIDDNPDFLRLWIENRKRFTKNKELLDIKKQIIEEDYLRFKGYLKNLTYYNNRFFIPK